MINFDQLIARQNYSAPTGTEIVAVQGASGTGGTVLNTIKAFVKAAFVANDITDAGTTGKLVLQTANLGAAKTLLEIPALPLAPVTLIANTTLGAAHINRRILVTADCTLTLDAAAVSTTDTLYIINVAGGTVSITINPGAGESLIVDGVGAAATYELTVNASVKVFRVDATTWFIET